MGGGAGRKSTKKPEEGDCVTLRWLGDHAHCTRCKENRWWAPCQSKHHWAQLDPAEREKYRRGSSGVDVELPEMRASAEIASEVIAKQLEEETADDPAPVKRKPEAQQHGSRTGSAGGLTSPPPAPRPATSEVSPATEHTIKSNPKLPWKKVKAGLQGFSKSFRLYKFMWSLPERQIIAVAAYRSCREQQFDTETSLAVAAGMFKHTEEGELLFKSVHIDTVRRWVKSWTGRRIGSVAVKQKRAARWALSEYPDLQERARQWIRSKANKKGTSNMRVNDFTTFVNTELLRVNTPSALVQGDGVTSETARSWLHYLGFSVLKKTRAIFKDGHDSISVTQYKMLDYLPKMKKLQAQALMPHHFENPDDGFNLTLPLHDALQNALEEAKQKGFERVVILHTHDESTYSSMDCQDFWWGERGFDTITSKSRGKGIMVSDWSNIATGWMQLTDEEFKIAKEQHGYKGPQKSRVLFEAGGDKWFCSDDLLEQVRQFKLLADYITEFIWKVDFVDHACRYDNAPSHRKRGPHALSARRMRKGVGAVIASCPDMRDTEFFKNGSDTPTKQSFKFKTGQNKGLLKGLTIAGHERGLWDKDGKVDGKAVLLDEMQSIMGDQPDFRDEPCLLEELHEQLGMFMLFAPRFHAELQLSIERAWATSKGGVREKCDYTITTLRKNIEPSLDNIPVELFRKWQRTEQQWEEAYRTGATQINVEGRVQQIKKTLYASHRVAPAAPPPPKSRKRSIGQISKMAHQQHVVLDDDFEKAPERKHKQWVKEMKLLYEKDDGTVHRLVDVAWCDDCADGEGGVESAMIGWTYECQSWSSHMPSRCGKLDYSRCYPYPITDVEQMVEDYAEAKAAGKLPWE